MTTPAYIEVGIDCRDPGALAAFWTAALGYEVTRGDGDPYLDLVPPRDDLPVVYLQRVPEAKTAKNRVHLDLYVTDPDAEIARLEGLGARRLGTPFANRDGKLSWQVMADPEGNEFCVCRAREG